MDLLRWIRPKPVTIEKYVVDAQLGRRQINTIRTYVRRDKYKVGDTVESVAYRQGQIDLIDFIEKNIMGGKL